MKCQHVHTSVNPTGRQWKCPRCGEVERFIIDSSPNDDCTKLHVADELACSKCGWNGTGSAFIKALHKAKATKPKAGADLRDLLREALPCVEHFCATWHDNKEYKALAARIRKAIKRG